MDRLLGRSKIACTVAAWGLLLGAAHPVRAAATDAPIFAYVGSYTPNGSGIGVYRMDPKTGELAQIDTLPVTNPSWIAVDASRTHFYAVSEVQSGSVRAYAVDPTTGAATFLNAVDTFGSGPVAASVDPLGQFVAVAHYGSGTVALLPRFPDGTLAVPTDVESDVGACLPACPIGPTQAANGPPGSFAVSGHDAPHAHMAQVDPAGNYVLVQDLGLDRTIVWQVDRTFAILLPNQTVPSSPGAGPRHLAFHPNGTWVYSLNEEASTITFMTYDPTSGTLTPEQETSTLPPGFAGTSFASEVVVSPNGKFVYAANRLHDTIAVLKIDKTGRLAFREETWSGGDYPRHIAIDPSGKFLFACNQRSDVVTTFRVKGSGHLAPTGRYMGVGSPAVIAFVQQQ